MERIHSLDSVKGIAIVCVVYFHIITQGQSETGNINLMLLVFPRFVIPYFFVVSGFLFARKINMGITSQFNYFKKYILTLIKMFVGCYFFYSVYDIVIRVLISIFLGENIKNEVISLIKSILNLYVIYYGIGNTAYHLWFLTALIWSIAVLFLFIKYRKLNLLLVISFLLNLIGLFGQTYSGIFDLPIDTRDALFFGLFYVTLGSFISVHYERIMRIVLRVKNIKLIYLVILSCVFQAVESLVTVKWFHGTKGGIGYYVSTIPLTISIFMLVLKNKNFGSNTILVKVGRGTLGIYAIHMLFISLSFWGIHFLNLEWVKGNTMFSILLAVVIFIVSYNFDMLTRGVIDKISNLILIKIPLAVKGLLFSSKVNSSKQGFRDMS